MKAYKIEVAQYKITFGGRMRLHERSRRTKIAVDDLVSSIPTWDEFRKFAVGVRESHMGEFLVYGTKDK